MKMQKMMYLTAAALLFAMSPVIAQDEESADSGSEEKTADAGAAKADGGEAAGEKAGEAAEKQTIFSDHQKQIKALREKKKKYEEAGRRRDAGKVLDTLKQEQRKLKSLYEKEANKIKTRISHLQEQSRKSSASVKQKLDAQQKEQEEALKVLETDAGIDTWCTELSESSPEKAGSGKSKTAPKSKSKKSKIARKKKKK